MTKVLENTELMESLDSMSRTQRRDYITVNKATCDCCGESLNLTLFAKITGDIDTFYTTCRKCIKVKQNQEIFKLVMEIMSE